MQSSFDVWKIFIETFVLTSRSKPSSYKVVLDVAVTIFSFTGQFRSQNLVLNRWIKGYSQFVRQNSPLWIKKRKLLSLSP